MFSEIDGSRKAIGDVDIIYHEGLYHLFHLVLPNHDFIAHAVSTDGVNWRRVKNALFIGDPGTPDDLMLWTMHVSPNPFRPGEWRMFYTGLSRRDQGHYQRLCMATSDDLYNWTKADVHWQDRRGPNDPPAVLEAREYCRSDKATRIASPFNKESNYPLSPDPRYYEASLDEGRNLVSFRDPYYYWDGEQGWLMAAGRVNHGPVVRRGCVALMKEVAENKFEAMPPLHHPGLYDDVEVPNLLHINGEYYLIGSIREDAKVRYWHSEEFGIRWRSYYDNVLLPQGNYAARTCKDENGWLLWHFYSVDQSDRTKNNLMPPPQRICRTPEGLLRTKTFEAFDRWIDEPIDTRCIASFADGSLGEQECRVDGSSLELRSDCGFQAFVFSQEVENFRFRSKLDLQGKGKCGIVFRLDPETRDGYYLSLDLMKGVAQLRAWGSNPEAGGEEYMSFRGLQSGYWHMKEVGQAELQLLVFGSYVELSVDGWVILSLADQTFQSGLFGIYLETAHLKLTDIEANHLSVCMQSDQHLTEG
ncbi:MAG: glycosyl hydrolase [Planctomyces sp.]|nr:glycosyl hydrolase [Planctomyces sp.]